VEITHNNPTNIIRHLDIHEPIQKLVFTTRCTWSINISKQPMSIIMPGSKINRDSIGIMKNKSPMKKGGLPNHNGPTRGTI
jgi:hypothetical protein